MSPPSVAKATRSDYAKQVVVIHIKTRQWQIWPDLLASGGRSKSILFALGQDRREASLEMKPISGSCHRHHVAPPGSFVQLGRKAQVNLQNLTVGHLLVDRAQRWKSFAQRDRLRGQDHLEA